MDLSLPCGSSVKQKINAGVAESRKIPVLCSANKSMKLLIWNGVQVCMNMRKGAEWHKFLSNDFFFFKLVRLNFLESA